MLSQGDYPQLLQDAVLMINYDNVHFDHLRGENDYSDPITVNELSQVIELPLKSEPKLEHTT